jgi:hypothetical protein
MKKYTKKTYEKWHFRKRAYERYGIRLRKKDIAQIRDIIENGEYLYKYLRTYTRWYYLIDFYGKIIYLIYDRKRHVPVTALPRENFFNMWRL